jgi:hypothetical protein
VLGNATRRDFLRTTGLGSTALAFACGRTGAAPEAGASRPNILWITSEDNSISWVSCYGSRNCKTPNIDKLAEEGFRYTHCFDNAAVCAPTRADAIHMDHRDVRDLERDAADAQPQRDPA